MDMADTKYFQTGEFCQLFYLWKWTRGPWDCPEERPFPPTTPLPPYKPPWMRLWDENEVYGEVERCLVTGPLKSQAVRDYENDGT